MKPTVTPLRYPGGKAWLIPYVKQFLKYHSIPAGTVVEPFAGSASVTIGLLDSNLMKSGIICENDPLLIAFWRSVLEHNEELCESVASVQVTMDTWWDFKKYLKSSTISDSTIVDAATAFIFYNRTNYSGIIKAGPLGGKQQKSEYKIDCRFNKERIRKKIRSLQRFSGRIEVHHGDGTEFIREILLKRPGDDLFFYVDPPYYKAGSTLYRKYFSDDGHIRLASTLKPLDFPWLLSYDDSEFIRNLYSSNELAASFVYTDYLAGDLKRGVQELLFSNRKIPPADSLADTSNEGASKIQQSITAY